MTESHAHFTVAVADLMTAKYLPHESLPPECELVFLTGLSAAERGGVLRRAAVIVAAQLSADEIGVATNLGLIQVPGAGTDGIPFAVLRPGTWVANTGHHGRAIAEYAIMAMLAMGRSIPQADRALRSGEWLAPHIIAGGDATLADNIEGQSVLVVGFGEIGRSVADLATRLDMKVTVATRDPNDRQAAFVDRFVGLSELDTVLGRVSYVVLALPLTTQTRHIIDERRLGLMQRDAIIVNVGRGHLIEPDGLYRALRDRRIGGAALDVWYRYPSGSRYSAPAEQPFGELDNVLLTPHISGVTQTTFVRRAADVAENIRRFSSGEQLINPVEYPTMPTGEVDR